MPGYVELVVSTAAYATGIVAQTVAARRACRARGGSTGIGLLGRLVADPLYLLGFAGQVTGFAFAFLARAELPLYLVQAATCGAVGLATAFGALALGWRVRTSELVMLVVLAAGIVLLASASAPAVAHDIPVGAGLLLLGLPLLVGAVVVLARTSPPVSLAVLAGAAFAVVAISSRSLADEPLTALPLNPLAWLMFLAAVLGQGCLATALARGSATSTVATMDAVTMVVTSVVGVAALGDRIVPGREWAVGLGLGLVVAGVLVLGFAPRFAAAAESRAESRAASRAAAREPA
ncbi:MAG TPA: hypothetical protein VHH15_11735 [Actinophytocola sp.]|nr:hypothetical protein [Actinophytocola sp.]